MYSICTCVNKNLFKSFQSISPLFLSFPSLFSPSLFLLYLSLLSFFAFLPSLPPSLLFRLLPLSLSLSFSSVNFIGFLLCAKEYPQVWEKILMRRMNVLLSFLARVPEWTLNLSIWLSLKWQAQPIRGGSGWIKRQWGWKRLQQGLPP